VAGVGVFEGHGFGLAEIAWVQHEQFHYYLELARQDGDARDWKTFRLSLLHSLTAPFGLGSRKPFEEPREGSFTADQERVARLLDQLRGEVDPETEWFAFVKLLWGRRGEIRADLA
jgi:hypothetical protein